MDTKLSYQTPECEFITVNSPLPVAQSGGSDGMYLDPEQGGDIIWKQ